MKIRKHPERITHYHLHEDEIKLGNVQCPVPLNKISIIENLNQLRINVFGYEDEEIYPLYISPKEDEDVVNLLLISDENENQHYCLIKNFSRLLGNLSKHNGQQFYCFRCLHRFCDEALLKDHLKYCNLHGIQRIKMPQAPNDSLRFTKTYMQHPISFAIYADFESLLVPISSATPSSTTSYTEKKQMHIPCGYAYVIIGPDGKSVKPISIYRGEDAVKHFLDSIIKEADSIGQKLKVIKPMSLSPEEERAFQEATHCKACNKTLGTDRRRDHCHLSGVYRGALHNSCNLNFQQPKCIPVVFHNLKNYDGHHIMTQIGEYTDHRVEVIAVTMEKYVSFKLHNPQAPAKLIFLDSFQFLPTSLEKLVKNLEPSQFNILKENFDVDTPLHLLTRKGVYPYEYVTAFSKFEETELPPPTAFFSSLGNESINNDDYQHALDVWKTFKIKNLGAYHDLYVKTDVLLLADVFQNFRKLCLKFYELDPLHNFTTPGLSWQACLKMCDTSLQLLTDINMLLLIEKGMRGGVSMISRRHAKANNPHVDDYDPTSSHSYIMYWDANNLYGWAMSQPLPVGGFEWVSAEKLTEEWILQLKDDAREGYIFEVDLDYPQSLHASHNEYPLAPEKFTITEDHLSNYAKTHHQHRKYTKSEKLIPNLCNKRRYVLHYRNLKYYIEQGLKLIKIHKALRFHQEPWLKKYIMFNTEKRKQATSSFEKDFFKLLNNSVFGKTMENLRRRRNIELCNTKVRGLKLSAYPSFKSFKIFTENLAAVERLKTSVLMNRPLYIGFTILELSKLLMYQFHYDFIKKTYDDRAVLLFTDTDSLTYHITTDDIYEDMRNYSSVFDFSDYPKSHSLYSEENKKVIGKFKDELSGKIAIEFAGVKAKMYSLKTEDEEKKRAKGISTRIVQKEFKHDNYINCILHSQSYKHKQVMIAQDRHELCTVQQNKVSLTPFDDKRYLLDDGITSYAYGHCDIE